MARTFRLRICQPKVCHADFLRKPAFLFRPDIATRIKYLGGNCKMPGAFNFYSILTKSLLRSATASAVPARIDVMNRYLLFTYYVGRSCGGMKDFLDSFDSVTEALENLLPEPKRYYQIVDRESLEIIKEGLTLFKDCDPESFCKE
jgi:hypothetical protein